MDLKAPPPGDADPRALGVGGGRTDGGADDAPGFAFGLGSGAAQSTAAAPPARAHGHGLPSGQAPACGAVTSVTPAESSVPATQAEVTVNETVPSNAAAEPAPASGARAGDPLMAWEQVGSAADAVG